MVIEFIGFREILKIVSDDLFVEIVLVIFIDYNLFLDMVKELEAV